MAQRVRVAVADDHAILREGIRQLLAREGDIDVVAEAVDASDVREVLEATKPDVLLLDLSVVGGLEGLRMVHEKNLQMGILVLSKRPADEQILEYLRAGARGAISKTETGAALAKAVRVIVAGETWVGRKATTRVIEELSALAPLVERRQRALVAHLTTRELKIAGLVAQGRNNREIAERLRLSHKTVKNHLTNIFQKFGLRNRSQLTALVLQSPRGET